MDKAQDMLEKGFSRILAGRLGKLEEIRSTFDLDAIQFPAVVFVGNANMGKSSILEGLTGIPFSKEVGTSAPIFHIFEKNSEISEMSVEVSSHPNGSNGTHCKSVSEVVDTVNALSGNTGNSSSIKRQPVYIRYVRQSGPEFTAIDLPGISEGEASEISKEIAEEYVKREGTVVLLVHAASIDLGNASALKIVQTHDGNGDRTALVLTKCDQLRENAEIDFVENVKKRCHETLDVFKKNGFVVLRNKLEEESESLEAIERKEFSREIFRGLEKEETGLGALIQKIVRIFERHVNMEYIPETKNCVEREMEKVQKELKAMEDFPTDNFPTEEQLSEKSPGMDEISSQNVEKQLPSDKKKRKTLYSRVREGLIVYKNEVRSIYGKPKKVVGLTKPDAGNTSEAGMAMSDKIKDEERRRREAESELREKERKILVSRLEDLKSLLEFLHSVSSGRLQQ